MLNWYRDINSLDDRELTTKLENADWNLCLEKIEFSWSFWITLVAIKTDEDPDITVPT